MSETKRAKTSSEPATAKDREMQARLQELERHPIKLASTHPSVPAPAREFMGAFVAHAMLNTRAWVRANQTSPASGSYSIIPDYVCGEPVVCDEPVEGGEPVEGIECDFSKPVTLDYHVREYDELRLKVASIVILPEKHALADLPDAELWQGKAFHETPLSTVFIVVEPHDRAVTFLHQRREEAYCEFGARTVFPTMADLVARVVDCLVTITRVPGGDELAFFARDDEEEEEEEGESKLPPSKEGNTAVLLTAKPLTHLTHALHRLGNTLVVRRRDDERTAHRA